MISSDIVKSVIASIWPKIIAPRAIYYHSIHPTNANSLKPELFRAHLDWLSQNHYQTLSFSDAVSKAKKKTLNPKTVCITFDDGYADNFQYAFPILKEFGMTATIFVVTSLIKKDNTDSTQGFNLLPGRPMLSAEQVKRMSYDGIEIGSHTHNHVHMKNTKDNSMCSAREELEYSKLMIEQLTMQKVTSFAYPNGQKGVFDNTTGELIREVGYLYAATTISNHLNSNFAFMEIPRTEIRISDNIERFKKRMLGKYDYLKYYSRMVNVSKKWGVDKRIT